MYNHTLHPILHQALTAQGIDPAGRDNGLYIRFMANAATMRDLYDEIYAGHPGGMAAFNRLIDTLIRAHVARPQALKERDDAKQAGGHWFLSPKISGMSLYVDRFAGDINGLPDKLDYFGELGVNCLHLMPVFESPEGESDGGYAVSDFRRVDPRFGTLEDLKKLQSSLLSRDMYLMLDIVLNHTSHRHSWAEKARAGDPAYQDYYYMYDTREIPDRFEQAMPEIFPESAPGNFTYSPECRKWVMTVFHNYQWDLNYRNPSVLVDMIDTILFYANLGVDILRIDAPAFIWKQEGTSCQNLPQAHTLLRLIRQCVEVAAPGMALLGEAIVAPAAIMKYFGTDAFTARECDFAYNATHMALQWDALATGDVRVMMAAQHELLQKPYGSSWINYTRCHDDIGLGYEDYMISQAGFTPYDHRKFIKEYYAGTFAGSPARGALFSVNPKTQDARISGSLASLCGLESAMESGVEANLELALKRILLMQAHSFFLGGLPMLFYGDEIGYTNDYSYLADPGKAYDNRWMHRPVIDWGKNARRKEQGTIEQRVFSATRKLLRIRHSLDMVGDQKNLEWLPVHNIHVAGYLRTHNGRRLFCIFNFSGNRQVLGWEVIRSYGKVPDRFHDHWSGTEVAAAGENGALVLEPYAFLLLEDR
jgi:amylosucrase